MLDRFVAVDLETTGLDPTTDEIIQIGAVRFVAGEPSERFSVFVRPQRALPLSTRVRRLTGISDDDLRSAATIDVELPRLLAFIGNDALVGHNIEFDLSFLVPKARAVGHPGVFTWFDTLALARVATPVGRHSLVQVAEGMGIDLAQAHRAGDDAQACGEAFCRLCQRVGELPPALLQLCTRLLEPVPGGLSQVFISACAQALTKPLTGRKARFLPAFPAELSFTAKGQQDDAEPAEPAPIDARAIAAEFGPDGCFARSLTGYEHRPPQAEMAMRVARALNRGEHLLVEAGTGTGKSLAYLLPALRFAVRNGERIVVATHTINLQEQLWHKDIPLLAEVLAEDIRAALVKGRANYVCLRKWLDTVEDDEPFLTAEERVFHARLAVWLQQTTSGDRSELNLFGPDESAWAHIAADSLTCLGGKCRFHKGGCFVMRARKAAEDANLLIVNHSLLFSDLSTENRVLPAYRHLIIDEAHNVEDTATQHLGADFGHAGCRSWLFGLYGGHRTPGYLGILRGRLQRLRSGDTQDIIAAVEDAVALVRDSATAVDEVFDAVRRFADQAGGDDDEGRLTVRVTAIRRESPEWLAVQSAGDNLVSRLKRLASRLNAIADLIGEYNDNHAKALKGVPEDLASFANAAALNASGLAFVLAAGRDDHVYWVETDRSAERQRGMVYAAPIRIGDILREKLFDRLRSVVLTSATLSVRGEFGFVADRLGLAAYGKERLATCAVASPFNYRDQALCCVPNDLPNPKQYGEREFRLATTEFLKRLLKTTNGKTLVLFTSHRMLRDVYFQLKPALEEADICLLAQGIDGSRNRLVADLQTEERTAVFGASSFWEGVDVPGEQLSCVVIVRLPFAAPGHPVTEARIEDIEQRGRSAFYDLSLPQAVIRFKQGFGRLIRRKDDTGVVVVLDPRVADSRFRYGRHFLDSLPGPTISSAPQEQILAEIGAWLGGARQPAVRWTSSARPDSAGH